MCVYVRVCVRVCTRSLAHSHRLMEYEALYILFLNVVIYNTK